jgi:hypothetical protein
MPDLQPDLVFRATSATQPNETWILNGTRVACRLPHRNPDGTPFVASGSWTNPDVGVILSAADLGTDDHDTFQDEHDGSADLLWQNRISSNMVAHVMAREVKLNGAFMNPPAAIDTIWNLVGLADLARPNGSCVRDGFVDLFWQHPSSKRMVAWFLGAGGSTITRGFGDFINRHGPYATDGYFVSPDGSDPLRWRVVALGDFDGDRHADILHQRIDAGGPANVEPDGRFYLWHMRGPNRRDAGTYLWPLAEPDLAWRIVAPR